MLHLYYGRACVETDRFLFREIGRQLKQRETDGERIFLLVPEQFTLQAERNAFDYLEAPGLMDLEILSQTRLGTRVLSEVGGASRVHIDRIGRHMLLNRILRSEADRLEAFRGLETSCALVERINDLISEFKQYNAAPETLEALEKETEDPVLCRKLKDLRLIYTRYEEAIAGVYLDSEDSIQLLCHAVAHSELIRGTTFWVSGFLSFTPKTMDLLEELAVYAKDVHVILIGQQKLERRDGTLFALSEYMAEQLQKRAERRNCFWDETELSGPAAVRVPELAHLEQELYAYPFRTWNAPMEGENAPVRFWQAGTFRGEAETAAVEICRLVREEGLRYRDIAVICNDMEVRGAEAGRVLREYGIPVFFDEKRGILHHAVVQLIGSILAVLGENWNYEDVFTLIKTGLIGGESCDWEDLENYALKYKIRGGRWKKPFVYGAYELGEEGLARMDAMRRYLTELLRPLEEGLEKSGSMREKTEALYLYLREELQVPAQLETVCANMKADGDAEQAEEVMQIWEQIMHLLDQMVELLGDQRVGKREFSDLLRSGLEAVEIGVIPPVIDQVLMGTMQRTRLGRIRAVFVLGANDGLLPMGKPPEDLLNEEERTRILGSAYAICKDHARQDQEETLAIYRNLSAPEQFLRISWSAADADGNEIRESMVAEKLLELYPQAAVEKDVLSEADPVSFLQSTGSAFRHLSDALRDCVQDEREPDPYWKAAYQWFKCEEPGRLELLHRGLLYRNEPKKIPESLAKELYCREGRRTLTLSPSNLERYARCPFSFFVNFGLRPEERRIFEVAGREIGDVYHQCLKEFAERLTEEGVAVTDPASGWSTLSRERCEKMIREIVERVAGTYRDGVLLAGEEERYRLDRITRVCRDAAWALTEQVRQGNIETMRFEVPFGQSESKPLPAVEIRTKQGNVLIEGIVDRLDTMPGQYVKILDYKSGSESFDAEEAKQGWKLQLMLYLRAVTESAGAQSMRPAGVFYFHIHEPLVEADRDGRELLQTEVEAQILKGFRMDGVLLDDPAVIQSVAGEFDSYSSLLPLRKTKTGIQETRDGVLLSEEAFAELREAVKQTVNALCEELAEGRVDVHPKKSGIMTACTYCANKNICNFELSFDGCRYDVIK